MAANQPDRAQDQANARAGQKGTTDEGPDDREAVVIAPLRILASGIGRDAAKLRDQDQNQDMAVLSADPLKNIQDGRHIGCSEVTLKLRGEQVPVNPKDMGADTNFFRH